MWLPWQTIAIFTAFAIVSVVYVRKRMVQHTIQWLAIMWLHPWNMSNIFKTQCPLSEHGTHLSWPRHIRYVQKNVQPYSSLVQVHGTISNLIWYKLLRFEKLGMIWIIWIFEFVFNRNMYHAVLPNIIQWKG